MKNKALQLIIILTLGTYTCYAQGIKLNTEQIGERIAMRLAENYKPDSVEVANLCRKGFFFIKFTINKKGKVSNIMFSKDSVTFIQKSAKLAVQSLQEDVMLAANLGKMNKIFVLPVLYDYDIGCYRGSVDMGIATQEDKAKYMSAHLSNMNNANHYQYNLFDMMKFGDKELPLIDCILLKPFKIGAMKGPGY